MKNFLGKLNVILFELVTGRGRLYHWGPNHAGDPVVTR